MNNASITTEGRLLELPPEERLKLAMILLDSLDQAEDQLDPMWADDEEGPIDFR